MKLHERFWSKVLFPEDINQCYRWNRTIGHGYGQVWFETRMHRAHRIAFLLAFGYLPPETVCIMHRCDNPACVNPGHLEIGTWAKNAQDMTARGRHADMSGDRNPWHKLSREEVGSLRSEYMPYVMTARMLSQKYGICLTQVWNILRGDQWK